MLSIEAEIRQALERGGDPRSTVIAIFEESLDFERVGLPVPAEWWSPRARGLVTSAELLACRGELKVVLARVAPAADDSEVASVLAQASRRLWRRCLVVLARPGSVGLRVVVICPRRSGRRSEARVMTLSAVTGRRSVVIQAIAALGTGSGTSPELGLQRLYRLSLPLEDPATALLYQFPRAVRKRIRGTPTEAFLRASLGHAILSQDEETELGRRSMNGDRGAWEELVLCNMRLAVSQMRRYLWTGVELDDLLQMAVMGLMRAAAKFDPTRGGKFSTYAVHWIRQSCGRASDDLTRTIRLPAYVAIEARALRFARRRAAQNLEPIEADLVIRRRLGSDAAAWLDQLDRTERLAGIDDCPDATALVAEGLDPAELIEQRHDFNVVMSRIEAEMASWRVRDREVLRRRFGLASRPESTLFEVGIALGITRERVRQIEASLLDRLRLVLRGEYVVE